MGVGRARICAALLVGVVAAAGELADSEAAALVGAVVLKLGGEHFFDIGRRAEDTLFVAEGFLLYAEGLLQWYLQFSLLAEPKVVPQV